MSLLEIILVAISLSMDAFAVSIMLGLSTKKLALKEILAPGLFFGFFQALMPLIGYFAGIYFVDKIQTIAHWLAFALLVLIGGKMIKESLSKSNVEGEEDKNSFQFLRLLGLAIATSIDALAIGITFAFLKVNVALAATITGLITFAISTCGLKLGHIFGIKFKSKAEFIGGCVLIILGVKILTEHLFFNGGAA
ncbi:MAG: manganese efflux pump MntP family protein [Proteobacteria bacterium]|nr:manganese efflux pump MntP family protein [Cystobacterineae bacterium]MCL2259044.1 manganese efflux pump MntP family protein [Cystobacterineae bacterium]MCL2314602.1 manganese efflux pump MntP family protein [Pseudomonadota bacterium]